MSEIRSNTKVDRKGGFQISGSLQPPTASAGDESRREAGSCAARERRAGERERESRRERHLRSQVAQTRRESRRERHLRGQGTQSRRERGEGEGGARATLARGVFAPWRMTPTCKS